MLLLSFRRLRKIQALEDWFGCVEIDCRYDARVVTWRRRMLLVRERHLPVAPTLNALLEIPVVYWNLELSLFGGGAPECHSIRF